MAEPLSPARPIGSVLAAVDFSPASGRAFEHALAVAVQAGARLDVLHAWHAPFWFPPPGTSAAEQTLLVEGALDSWRESAERELDLLRERARAERVACRAHLETGVASRVIADTAKALAVDLVVVGSRGRSALSHVLLGSTAERVMRLAACPVVVVPEGTEVAKRLPLRRILVAVDYSPSSQRALGLALRLGAALGHPEILLVYAVHVPVEVETLLGSELGRALDAVENRPQERLDEWSRRLREAGWKVSSRVVFERPEDAIVEVAASEDVDLIALGAHGHPPIAAAVLGSVAGRVLRRAPCPVAGIR